MQLPQDIYDDYDKGGEISRLDQGLGPLGLARTQELIARFLPAPPAKILDIGGGPGRYAAWLARQGYEVHLLDLIPLHIEQATAVSSAQAPTPIQSIQRGDARDLPFPDGFASAALLPGPLYHISERDGRLRALQEARRVLGPGGLLLAAAGKTTGDGAP